MSTGIVSISDTFLGTIPPEVHGVVQAKLNMLRDNPESPGLHVEPLHAVKDDRLRSVRINKGYRLLVFQLNNSGQNHWLVEGIYEHEKAYRRARTLYLRVNEISGAAEIRTDAEAIRPEEARGGLSESEVKRRVAEEVAATLAQREALEAARRVEPVREVSGPVLTVSADQLVSELGIDRDLAERAVTAGTDELLDVAHEAPTWQGNALVDLATGATVEQVRDHYFTGVTGGTEVGTPSGTEELIQSITAGRAGAEFRMLEDDQALERVLASGDFARWRIFLHPEQDTYVNVRTRGPYRLTGGAGTGKTVVLVHRAVRLAREAAAAGREPRIILTTYVRNLADALENQVRSLEPDISLATSLGNPGVLIHGVDRIARAVLTGADVSAAAHDVLGWGTPRPSLARPANEWEEARRAVLPDAATHPLTAGFLADEYREVILPHRITDEGAYLRVARPGRGARLGRRQRREVWAVVEKYREQGRREARLDWDEVSAVAAAQLDREAERTGCRPADHVLVDEGQDLRPTQWQMLRALVEPGPDDLFIAEDTHQRIYSNPVRLGRYGIAITGRSRRLRLNYRTTAQNLALAVGILRGAEFDIAAMDDEAVDGTDTGTLRSARSGPEPELYRAETAQGEFDTVASVLSSWIDEVVEEDLDPSTIGILTRWGWARDTLVRALDERGITVASIDREQNERRGAPLVMTIHRAKGMEFSRVILFGMDERSAHVSGTDTDSSFDEQAAHVAELQERALLYVGASRARDRLAITWNRRPNPFLPLAGDDPR